MNRSFPCDTLYHSTVSIPKGSSGVLLGCEFMIVDFRSAKAVFYRTFCGAKGDYPQCPIQ
jgi:hypothetical protein